MWLSAGDRGEPCAQGRSSTRALLILTLLGPAEQMPTRSNPSGVVRSKGFNPAANCPRSAGTERTRARSRRAW